MKSAVVYWSGTGNTEAMAQAVAEGMTAAGAEAVLLTPDQVQPGDLNTYGAIAFGCPAMGSEVLEEMEFQPMFDACKRSLGARGSHALGNSLRHRLRIACAAPINNSSFHFRKFLSFCDVM